MFEEYDVVRARKCLNEKIPNGSEGTVLIVYPSIPPQYEVEFIDKQGYTLGLITVSDEDIEKI